MVRIVCLSDTHNRHHELDIPKCDLLIHAGDFCQRGDAAETYSFISWFCEQTNAKERVFIAGNHDFFMQRNPSQIPQRLANDTKYLYNSFVELNCGLKVWGSPWTPYFFDWAFNGTDEENGDRQGPNLNEIFGLCPADVDIMVTHGPIRGILDRNQEGDACGSHMLKKHVDRVKPRFHICGHIHEGHSTKPVRLSATMCYNASISKRNYNEPLNPIVVIDL